MVNLSELVPKLERKSKQFQVQREELISPGFEDLEQALDFFGSLSSKSNVQLFKELVKVGAQLSENRDDRAVDIAFKPGAFGKTLIAGKALNGGADGYIIKQFEHFKALTSFEIPNYGPAVDGKVGPPWIQGTVGLITLAVLDSNGMTSFKGHVGFEDVDTKIGCDYESGIYKELSANELDKIGEIVKVKLNQPLKRLSHLLTYSIEDIRQYEKCDLQDQIIQDIMKKDNIFNKIFIPEFARRKVITSNNQKQIEEKVHNVLQKLAQSRQLTQRIQGQFDEVWDRLKFDDEEFRLGEFKYLEED